jgi:type III pantothenate kinase
MIIAVDIGNTNIVCGIFNNEKLEFIERISTDHNITDLEYLLKFKSILSLHEINIEEITGSVISSVVPAVSRSVFLALKRLTSVEPKMIGRNLKTDLNINIDNPKTLGSDLIVDAVAVINEYSVPAAVIDMGTATTISVIDKNKNYIGGMIIPGINISLEALTSRTSQLPKISLEAPESIIAKNTTDCMKSGIIFGTASQID